MTQSQVNRTILSARERTTVYLQRGPDGPVVLKVLAVDRPSVAELVRFANDLELTRDLEIDGVRRGLRRERIDGRHALVLEYAEGAPLRCRAVGSTRELIDALRVGARLARIVGEVHEARIVHKDIKPSNIIVDPATGAVRLIDFGLASRLALRKVDLGNPASLEGTLAYVSPEQTGRMNRVVDWRTDLYSLGATLYELLAGHPPFLSADPVELVHAHIAQLPRPLHEVNPNVPPAVSAIVGRLLAKEAEDRYQSGLGLAHDLELAATMLAETGAVEPFPLGRRDVSARFHLPQRLYGRERDVAGLLAACARAAEGRPELVLVTGSSGVGKSALVHEVHRPVAERRGAYVEGKFDPLQRNIPYSAPIQAFSALVDRLLGEGEAGLAAWRARILAAVGDSGEVLTAVIPNLGLVLGPQPAVPPLRGAEANNRLQYLLRAFVRAVATAEHPLVLFLDDLQWADLASLQLLTALLTDPDSRHVLVIGAYRDGEIGHEHPLPDVIASVERAAEVHRIALGPLAPADVDALVADALAVAPTRSASLATLVHERTGGNAFFVRQLLLALDEQGAIAFDRASLAWTWDLEAARKAGFTDDVVELMTAKIARLPADSAGVLQTAACLGGRFELATLATVAGRPADELATALWPAIQAGLVEPITGGGHATEDAAFAFVHDRVQQAAYARLEAGDRAALHARIGRLLLDQTPRERRAERLFDIVNQLDLGREHVTGDARGELARLNLEAGRRALASGAHAQALTYLNTGIELQDGWERDPATALQLTGSAALSAYFTSDFDAAEKLADEVLSRANAALDKVDAWDARIMSAIARDDMDGALRLGVVALGELGVGFPAKPSPPHVGYWLIRTKIALWRRPLESLLALPPMTDPARLAAMVLMERLVPAAFRAGSLLFPLFVFRMVNLSLQYGNMPVSTFGFAAYGITLCGVLGDLDGGYAFGQLALKLSERFDSSQFRSKAYFVWANFVRHWKDPLPEVVDPMRTALRLALEAGSTFDAVWSAFYGLVWRFETGEDLAAIEAEIRHDDELFRRDEGAWNASRLLLQVIGNLRGPGQFHRLLGPEYDEERMRERTSSDRTHVAFYHAMKLQLCVISGATDEAVKHAEAAEALLEAVTAMPWVPIIAFYGAVARLDQWRPIGEAAGTAIERRRTRNDALDKARRSLKKLRRWARSSPANHQHKVELVEAELARAVGDLDGARAAYERAVLAARSSGFVNEEALAFQRAAAFYASVGNPVLASAFSRESIAAWTGWGASAVAEHLGDSAPLGARESTLTNSRRTTSSTGGQLDLASLFKAAGAITGEIVLEKLLTRLVEIVVENAGAGRGAVLLQGPDDLRIEAETDVSTRATSVRAHTALSATDHVIGAFVRFAVRTGEALVIDDAQAHPLSASDAGVRARGVRSVLCVPIKAQGRTVGVLYLENNATPGAFTPDRVEILELLAAQAAIGLENARLYDDLEGALEAQVRLTDAHKRFVPNEFMHALGRDSIVDVALGDSIQQEMSILFSDMRKFTSHVEGMTPEQNIRFINRYLGFMEPPILRHGGFVDSYIGDAIMALFEGSPDQAVQAGIGMLRALADLNRARAEEGLRTIDIGVGINTGRVTLGTIGGPERIKCGVIGDPVNLAARVESLTKHYGVGLLIGDATVSRLVDPRAFGLRAIDRVRVVGRLAPVTLFEVFDADPRRDEKFAASKAWDEACELYYSRRFDEAARAFAAYPVAGDPQAARFVARCRTYAEDPPADGWDGVEEMAHK
jgi:predicted ATPase/class 3 adenylate cyclase